ncbi:MAG: hypothetical protein KatS3mg102_0257 [Planctomycetota bacterium]|nr:MAG: hypothetical protein KatS3mg102_0257 [Planctomycetota bacterium]
MGESGARQGMRAAGRRLGAVLVAAWAAAPAALGAGALQVTVRDLGTAGLEQAQAADLDRSGAAVGHALERATGRYLPFRWAPGGQAEPLPLLAGDDRGLASATNDAGLVVGWSGQSTGGVRPVAWRRAAGGGWQVVALPLGGFASGMALDCNEAGWIAGQGLDPQSGRTHALRWRPDPLTGGWQLEDVHGLLPSGTHHTRLSGIDQSGARMCGEVYEEPWVSEAFLLELGNAPRHTPVAQSDLLAVALDLNDAAEIVGYRYRPVYPWQFEAYHWEQSAGLRVLPDLGGGFSGAAAIEETGWIAGVSALPQQPRPLRAVLWEPDPLQPSGYALQRLPGLGGTDGQSRALGIRERIDPTTGAVSHRLVAGWAEDAAGQAHAVVWEVQLGGGPAPPPAPLPLVLSVRTDRTSYRRGETAHITVTVTDSAGQPLGGAQLTVEVSAPSGRSYRYAATAGPGGSALFTHRLRRGDGRGAYQVVARAAAPGYLDGTASTGFLLR